VAIFGFLDYPTELFSKFEMKNAQKLFSKQKLAPVQFFPQIILNAG